ncbi:hypothetical protein M9458_051061, partial [Cirrhinus mrigala]
MKQQENPQNEMGLQVQNGNPRVPTQQQERNKRNTPRALQNDLQQASGVYFSDQTVSIKLHKGSMRARHLLVGPVLKAKHCAAGLAYTGEHLLRC